MLAGVDFMAETAAILNPTKTVVHPEPLAQCAMASRLTVAEVEHVRARYPGVAVVAYVNSSAAVKAASDICCTSANAVRVVGRLDEDEVIFAPDRNLAAYVAARTGKDVIHAVPATGCCPVHQALTASPRSGGPGRPPRRRGDGPPRDLARRPGRGRLHRLDLGHDPAVPRDAGRDRDRRDRGLYPTGSRGAPDKVFVPASPLMACADMRMITLDLVVEAVRIRNPVVRVDPTVAGGARRALERMLAVS